MPVERVGIEGDFRIEALQLAVLGDDQRVDLEHRHVLGDEGGVEIGDELAGLLGEVAGEAERLRHGAAVVRHHAGRRIDREGMDLLGRLVSDVLDVHAAFRRDDEGNAPRGAVDEGREVELALDIGAVLDIDAVDLLAGRSGLDRDEGVAEHLADEGLDLIDGLGEAHAALLAGLGLLELALAAAAGVDLALHHPQRAAKLLGGGFGLIDRKNGPTSGNGGAEFLEDGLALVLVNIHPFSLSAAELAACPAEAGHHPAPRSQQTLATMRSSGDPCRRTHPVAALIRQRRD
ncbi:hypothetical protein CHELA40_11740 [Chelatococcus asaccharovorans]|nr:hypothetical protein CHELA40_11740 [Chelatococcus asaccharovorans]CAH1684161.1 hypothetical protein CHELA17_63861 [Chelatococcus asaccharovorans]